MIYGVGTDLASIERMGQAYARHGKRLAARILAPAEVDELRGKALPAAFLAKRFAAKEALAKALRTGFRGPVVMPNIAVAHDEMGRPYFDYAPALAAHLRQLGVQAHLSVSDETDYALAFVVAETLDKP